MKPWELIDSETAPGGNAAMELLRRDDEYVIRIDGQTLMSTRTHGSEDALANIAFERLEQTESCRVLVGGLGMGFTAAAALKSLPPQGELVVAEFSPAVIRWNRGPAGDAAGNPLHDERLRLYDGDVIDGIKGPQASWSAILLDTDNGPTALSSPGNQWLYAPKGLAALYQALKPGGVLTVWSANEDASFTHRMEKAGFVTEVVEVRARGKRGARHRVWVGIRPGKGN